MASLIRWKKGFRIEWVKRENGTESRPRLKFADMDRKTAQSIKHHVEELVAGRSSGTLSAPETVAWLGRIDDALHARLVNLGLAKPRDRRTLGAWLTAFMEGKDDLKPESRRKLEQTKAKLMAHFTEERGLVDISAEDASAWRRGMADAGLSVAAVKTHVGNAKSIFAEAKRLGLVAASPFAHLTGGVTPTANQRYVTPEEMEAVLANCPDSEWRLLFGLARYAGLRTPSETHLLTWGDVDWDRARLRVRSPKTERFAGHAERIVPIDPRLMALLRERFDLAPEGDVLLVGSLNRTALHRRAKGIIEASKVEAWDDLWQTLRRSCEIEWAQTHPQYAVSRWIGHSITVSGRHYANSIPDELFDRASGRKGGAQKGAQHRAESTRTAARGEKLSAGDDATRPLSCGAKREGAQVCATSQNGAGGNRTPVPEQSAGSFYARSR